MGTLVYLLKEGESEEAEEDVLKADTSWETILRVMQLRSVRTLILVCFVRIVVIRLPIFYRFMR